MLTKREAIYRALEAGATMDEINREAEHQVRHVGSVPFRNMMRALNMMTWKNTRTDWVRLAGSHVAKGLARRAKAA